MSLEYPTQKALNAKESHNKEGGRKGYEEWNEEGHDEGRKKDHERGARSGERGTGGSEVIYIIFSRSSLHESRT